MTTTQPAAFRSPAVAAGGKVAKGVDGRLASSSFLRKQLTKVFPDHWSFMLGEVALYSFIILLLSGVFLTFWYKPSMVEVIYDGSYIPLKGIRVSEAYASSLDISFDIRGGLLMRQVHHWAALIFLAAMIVHMFRVFFTGAFRKPREMNWLIGIGLITLGLVAGFAGYSLPDDLLSGTGLRIAQGIMLSLPIVGTYVAFFVFGGEFPGTEFISRLYTVHVLLIPGIILALITAHLMMVWYQKHTQYPGAGRTETNVVGYPLLPVYMAKAGGFFFVVFGLTMLLGALATINPIWAFGPYNGAEVTAGSQPDWYIGFMDGALRIMPPIEFQALGRTWSMNVMVPSVVVPGILFTLAGAYPWIEAFVTGDKREHHLLDRPRNQPTRTALGTMAITMYCLLWFGGGNDIVAAKLGLSINDLIWFVRIGIFVVPPLVFLLTRRICIGMQRRDADRLLHGRESGRILRLPHGEFVEIHAEDSLKRAAVLRAGRRGSVTELPPATDENGVRAPGSRKEALRQRLQKFYFGGVVVPPTPAELAAAHAHGQHEALDVGHDNYAGHTLEPGDDVDAATVDRHRLVSD